VNGWERFLQERKGKEMSDAIIVKDSGESFERELPPAEPTLGICWNVFNVGLQDSKFGPKPKVLIYWEIDVRYTKGDYTGKRMLLSQEYTASLSSKAYLRRDLEKWRGKPFSEEQLKGFDLMKLKGVPALLNVVHRPSGETTYANIDGIMKAPAGATLFTLETDSKYLPKRVENLLSKKIVQENEDTDKVAEAGWNAGEPTASRPPTEKEIEIF
jgi:hypothetical protein